MWKKEIYWVMISGQGNMDMDIAGQGNKVLNCTPYGYRWPATEGIFSAVKRIFGEQIHARSELGIIQEAKIKFWGYQKMKRYGEA